MGVDLPHGILQDEVVAPFAGWSSARVGIDSCPSAAAKNQPEAASSTELLSRCCSVVSYALTPILSNAGQCKQSWAPLHFVIGSRGNSGRVDNGSNNSRSSSRKQQRNNITERCMH
mmetsp:Transcript_94738/g.187711  ORF Transcript_94738/g.187711 Transcript_94738/m.187711 type:complete len:116 (-) Transcript_94738:85-432(-)